MPDYMTFQNIYQAVMVAIGDNSYARTTEVKAICNMVYLNEICQADELYPLNWLLDLDDSKKGKVRATATAITKANPPVVTAVAHGFVSGDLVTAYNVTGMTELEARTFVVVKDSADAFHLHDLTGTNIDASAYGAAGTAGYFHHRGVTLTDCAQVLRAGWYGYNKGMDLIGPDLLEDEASWTDSSRSRPLKAMHRKVFTAGGDQMDYLFWYRAPDAAYSLRVWVEKMVSRLSADGDVPIGPIQVGDAIVSGAITRLGENKAQIEAGVVWPAIYRAHIAALVSLNRKWWQRFKKDERSAPYLL